MKPRKLTWLLFSILIGSLFALLSTMPVPAHENQQKNQPPIVAKKKGSVKISSFPKEKIPFDASPFVPGPPAGVPGRPDDRPPPPHPFEPFPPKPEH